MAKSSKAVPVKITFLGGGSKGWSHGVMRDLATCDRLSGEVVLHDINYAAAAENVPVGKGFFGHRDARTKFTVRAEKKIGVALKDADFVIIAIQPGPRQFFANDLDIPAKYGILQTVGDTVGPGGLSRALRSVPIMQDYARQIMHQCPSAWVINYANPMTLCTAALYAEAPDIQAFGCCHEVFGAQHFLAGVVQEQLGLPSKPQRHEIVTDVCGVNHFTLVTEARYRGLDILPLLYPHISRKGFFDDQTALALANKAKGNWFHSPRLIACDIFKRFGALGAAGDRHLAEFVPWYLTSEAALHRWGVVATPSSFRINTWKPAPGVVLPKPPPPPKRQAGRLLSSGEEGIEMMCSLVGAGNLDSNVNLPNVGQAADLPMGAVVETNAQFRHNTVRPVVAKALPAGADALMRRIVEMQQLTLQAAICRDLDLAFQALLLDALVTIPPDKAWKMLREMLKANQALMKGWKL
jgi:alpha-galactosidase